MVLNEKKFIRMPKWLLAVLLIVFILIIIGLVIGLIILGVKNAELSQKTTKITTIATTISSITDLETSSAPTKEIVTITNSSTTPSTISTKEILTTTTSSTSPSTISTKVIVTTTTSSPTILNKSCKNYGQWKDELKKCQCFSSTFGDYCENGKFSTKLNQFKFF